MKKYLLILPVLAVLLLPNFTSAATVAELQALINQLQAQIQQLQAQLTAQTQGQVPSWCYDFNANLKFGDKGEGVTALQTVLEKQGFTISQDEKSGKYFDESTASAVSGFQEKYKDEILTPLGLKYATGFVGKATRTKLNSLYGCGGVVVQPPVTPQPPTVSCSTPICPSGYTLYDTGEKDSYGCLIKKCISPTIPTIPTNNQPPVIYGISGPTTLKVNETGTWTVTARDPEQGILTYSVVWGDEAVGVFPLQQRSTIYTQTATFTHSYSQTGIYTSTFTVTDNQGLSAKTSISVNVGAVITPSITVLSPNGGENFVINNPIPVSWSANYSSKSLYIMLHNALYEDRNTGNIFVSQPITGMSGVNNFTVPSSGVYQVGRYKINICDYNQSPAVCDYSDSEFTITSATSTQPSITVLSPNGGEVWKFGETHRISWQIEGNDSAWSIQLMKGGTLVALWNYSSGLVPGQNYIDWQIQPVTTSYGTIVAGNDYKIRLIVGEGLDESDAAFSIVAAQGTLSFSQSSFNFSYTQGGSNPSVQSLTFTNTSNVNVNFTISVPNQPSWLNTGYNTSQLTAYPGSPIGLGASVDPSNLIPATYTTNIVISGNFTGSPFTIPVTLTIVATTTPSITVLSPNGGEVWPAGSVQTIRWNSSNLGSLNVSISLADKNSYITGEIAQNIPNSSSYTWAIPLDSKVFDFPNYKILVSTFDKGPSAQDFSDASFSIVASGVGQSSTLNQMANVLESARGVLNQLLEVLKNQ